MKKGKQPQTVSQTSILSNFQAALCQAPFVKCLPSVI